MRAIDATEETLDLALHGLSLMDAAEAIVRAKERIRSVRVVVNEEHMFPSRGRTRSAALQLLIDTQHPFGRDREHRPRADGVSECLGRFGQRRPVVKACEQQHEVA